MSQVKLTSVESDICKVLLKAAAQLPLKPQLRIVGGWVRDKLLGLESHDLDVAVDNMKGYDFALAVSAYCRSNGLLTHVGKIEANPEKSKHLETGTMKLFGQFVDFVNLRREDYCEDSRIPEFGTPLQDASRRDITMNALFYNLHNNLVEDFTTLGLSDLKNGFIRTPSPAAPTFLDDPLRILRVIRFACRFNFTIDADIYSACKNFEVVNGLATKVSRERIGVEIDKMVSSDFVRAFKLLKELNVLDIVLAPPSGDFLIPGDNSYSNVRNSDCISMADLFQKIESHPDLPNFCKPLLQSEQSRLMRLSILVSPYCAHFYLEKKKNKLPATKYLSAIDASFTSAIILSSSMIQSFITEVMEGKDSGPSLRKKLGLFVRNLGLKPAYTSARPLGQYYILSLVYSMLDELRNSQDHGLIFQKYTCLWNLIEEYGVKDAVDLKPLLNGAQVSQIKKLKGHVIGEILAAMIEYQLEFPNATTSEIETWLGRQIYIGTWNMNSRTPPKPSIPFDNILSSKYNIIVFGTQESSASSWLQSLCFSVKCMGYSLVKSKRMGALFIAVFIKDLSPTAILSGSSATGKGCLKIFRRKGGVYVAIKVLEKWILFVNSHFSAHQENILQRKHNFNKVSQAITNKCMTKLPGFKGLHSWFDYIFWFGDLNYRVNGTRALIDSLMIKNRTEVMFSNDQLTNEMKSGSVFPNYKEAKIGFAPTYKFDTIQEDSSCCPRRNRHRKVYSELGPISTITSSPGAKNLSKSDSSTLDASEPDISAVTKQNTFECGSIDSVQSGKSKNNDNEQSQPSLKRNLKNGKKSSPSSSLKQLSRSVTKSLSQTSATAPNIKAIKTSHNTIKRVRMPSRGPVDKYDTSKKGRIPSWTDRILYYDARGSGVIVEEYNSCVGIRTSDHKPVYGIMIIK